MRLGGVYLRARALLRTLNGTLHRVAHTHPPALDHLRVHSEVGAVLGEVLVEQPGDVHVRLEGAVARVGVDALAADGARDEEHSVRLQ